MDHFSFIYQNENTYLLPAFGYKIHVSATWANYREVKDRLLPFLTDRKVAYKYLKDEREVWLNFSDDESPAESGKFFTIYPKNHQHFLELLEALYDLLPKDWEGIYILSDRPYKDSNLIFYRYGSIAVNLEQMQNGLPTLIGPTGEKWQDYQKTDFDLPPWIADIQPDDTVEESYLGDHYAITSMKKSSNGGNIYTGHRLKDGQPIIMKETRPHILAYDSLTKAVLRENEYAYACRLMRHTPKAIERVDEWLNTYYIYEEIVGEDFYSHINSYTIFSYRSETLEQRKENLSRYHHFLKMTDRLLEMVDFFHQRNLVLHDIHPNNIIVDKHNELYFVDLEHAYDVGESPLSGIYHEIALKAWNGLEGQVADCHKLANLLLYCLARLQIKQMPELTDHLEILHHLLEHYGIRTDLRDFFHALLSPQATINRARELLKDVGLTTGPSDVVYELDVSALDGLELTAVTFDERVRRVNKTLNSYQEAVADRALFSYRADVEQSFGLEGLLGSLVLLEKELPRDLLADNLAKVRARLVKTASGLALSIRENIASPYFDTGTAGYIQALLEFDQEQYLPEIVQLANSFDFEFAQRPGYEDGMLGIAATLIQVYGLAPKPKYLQISKKLLVNTSFYVHYGKVNGHDFAAVLGMLVEEEKKDAKNVKE